jgi:hypothetical protein
MSLLHRHHTIPRHAGGTDDPSNIEYLTVAAHVEAHRLLYERYGRWQDLVAYRGLAGIINHEEAVREALSFAGRKLRGYKHPFRRKSPEHVAKVAAALRGKHRSVEQRANFVCVFATRVTAPKTIEHLQKIIEKAKRPKSAETRRKMSEARKLFWQRKRSA